MRWLRWILLLVVCLIPLGTLAHRGDLGRWEWQRSAMAGPDEFSYLLMADHFLQGGGLSLKASIGRDTFYPPGYPIMLAAWGKVFGLTAFTAHVFNACVLCVDTLIAYLFSRRILRLLATTGHRRFHLTEEACGWLGLLVAAVFATNWHVLETSLLIMSEPVFMLATFAWLAVALKWRDWPAVPWKAAVVGALAVVAWSIRGAGIVCMAATILYPALLLVTRKAVWRRLAVVAVIVVLAGAYQVALIRLSPEKAVTAGEESANSYPKQLMHGLTDGGRLQVAQPADWPGIAINLGGLVLHHLTDYASSFVPWYRDDPDFHFRNVIGKILGLLGFMGWLWHATRIKRAETLQELRFLDLYVALYFALYLVWPFDFARFWSPILPVMMVYAADAAMRFTEPRRFASPAMRAAVLPMLLLLLAGAEDVTQLPNYGRRLNYVSEALEGAVRAILKDSPDAKKTVVCVMNGDDHFAMAWYFSQEKGGRGVTIASPSPHVEHIEAPAEGQGKEQEGERKGAETTVGKSAGEGAVRYTQETVDALLERQLRASSGRGVYLVSYFGHADARWWLGKVEEQLGGGVKVEKIWQKEIISGVWRVEMGKGERAGDGAK